MGEGELVPLPIFRCPCRRQNPNWAVFCRELFTFDSYEHPASIRVYSKFFGRLRLVLMLIVFVSYLWYQLYVTKGYLERAPIFGISRMQLQHPVKAGCNPLESTCMQKMRPFSDLPYCSQNNLSTDTVRHPCKHFTEFELLGGQEAQKDAVLLSTRRTTIDGKVLCDGMHDNCTQMYQIEDKSTVFVADAESWTLLIDHGFTCDELGTSLAAWHMQGFYTNCLHGSFSGTRLGELEGEEECQRVPIDHVDKKEKSKTDTLTEEVRAATRRIWTPEYSDKEPDFSVFREIPNGDVLQIRSLLKMLKIDLDAMLESGPHKGRTLRQEGVVVVLEIEYNNYKTYSMPNSLPPIYTYHFKIAPISEFKIMQAGTQTSREGGKVVFIDDRHGIYFVVRQRGTLGMFSKREAAIMVVEFCILLSLIKWFTTFLALNWYKGQPGDDFEEQLCRGVMLQTGGPHNPYDGEKEGFVEGSESTSASEDGFLNDFRHRNP